MNQPLHKNQSGLASIVIAILIVIILSSMVFGFSQIITREQRQSLDNQLSSQAFYAAESAVNDATKAIAEQDFVMDKTECPPYPSGAGPASLSGNANKLTGDGNVQYTCLLIDQKPSTLEYKSIRTDHAVSFPVAAADGSPVSSVSFGWRSTEKGYDQFRSPSDRFFSTAGSWNSTGILRVDIVPVGAGTFDRANLETVAKSFFLYPNGGGDGVTPTTIPYGSESGAIVNGSCGPTGSGDAAKCNVRITGLPGIKSYVRLISIYNPVTVSVEAANSAGVKINDLKDAQIDVDATGKAADVVRRINVRIPRQSSDMPDFAIASMDSLCKKFLIRPDAVFNDSSVTECNINR